jgi:uncharacterized protein YndB with AHSA1/START domain
MGGGTNQRPDPRFDLVLDRVVDLNRELIWRAWTDPALIKQWFCPAPWSVIDCEIDLRPSGLFKTVMRSPEGQEFTNVGCYLEIVENERLVWTDALGPGYRPAEKPFFTGIISLSPEGAGTRYHVIARHKDEATRKSHEDMGFEDGWSICLDQLVTLMQAA